MTVFDTSDEKQKAKGLLNLLQKIHVKINDSGEIEYSNGIVGSSLYEIIAFLVSNESQKRPWDLRKFLNVLKSRKGLSGIWNLLATEKRSIVQDLISPMPTDIFEKKPSMQYKRKKSISPIPPIPPGSPVKWKSLF